MPIANIPCAALPKPPRTLVASTPITLAPASLAAKAASVPDAPMPITNTSVSTVSSSPFLVVISSTSNPACSNAAFAALMIASLEMVEPDTTSILGLCFSLISFANFSAATPPLSGVSFDASIVTSSTFPLLTFNVTLISPPKPCSLAENSPSFAPPAFWVHPNKLHASMADNINLPNFFIITFPPEIYT